MSKSKPWTPKMQEALGAVLECAQRDLMYCPSDIGQHSACAALVRRGLLLSDMAVHEETTKEGLGYHLSLRPTFNRLVGAALKRRDIYLARLVARAWDRYETLFGSEKSPTPPSVDYTPTLWLVYTHVQFAAYHRVYRREAMVLLHLTTANALLDHLG